MMYDMLIIGAGPAGLSAAIYGVRAGKSVLVLEGKTYGGQIINTPEVENYPGIQKMSGFEFARNLYEQAKRLGAEIKMEKVISLERQEEKPSDMEAAQSREEVQKSECGRNKETVEGGKTGKIVEGGANEEAVESGKTGKTVESGRREGIRFQVHTSKGVYEGAALILAMGARNRLLGLPGEQELTGAGISYCATCDGMFYKDKAVAVNGGGSTALEDALFLSNYCKEVYLIHRRDTFRGERRLLEALEKRENVRFVLNSVVTGLAGEGRLLGINIKNKNGEEKELAVEGLFIAIGQEPETAVAKEMVAVDERGYIRAGEDCRTTVPGVFAAGDCRTKAVRQLTTAAADGAVAALMAAEYLG